MRRPVLYLAGLLLATGASLALAGPASAAPAHDSVKVQGNHWWLDDECDEDDDNHYYGGNTYQGVNILNDLIDGPLL